MAEIQKTQVVAKSEQLDIKEKLKQEQNKHSLFQRGPLTDSLITIDKNDINEAKEVTVLMDDGFTRETRKRVQLENDSNKPIIEFTLGIDKYNGQTKKIILFFLQVLSDNLPHFKYENDLSDPKNIKLINDKRKVTFSLHDFMTLFNLKDTKKGKENARALLRSVSATLYNLSITGTEIRWEMQNNRKKKIDKTFILRLLDGVITIKRDTVQLNFAMTLSEYMATGYVMLLPVSLYQIDTKENPNSVSIGYFLDVHHSRNIGKKYENYVKGETLLKQCSFKETDEKSKKYRHDNRKVKSIEKDLDALIDIGFIKEWTYCNKNGESLTEKDRKHYEKNGISLDDFKKLYIKFQGIEEPPGYRENKTKQIETSKKKKQQKDAAK